MPSVKVADDRATRAMRWIARIWGTLIVAIALIFIVGYAWSWVTTGTADPNAVEDYPPIENLPPLFAFLSVLGLALAWRWEGLGGGIAVVFSLAMLPVLLIHWPIAEDFPRFLIPYGVWAVLIIPGILFLICWRRSKRRASTRPSA